MSSQSPLQRQSNDPSATGYPERKLFAPPVTTMLERKPETSVFIKKDYLPSPGKVTVEKCRDDVARILHFGTGPSGGGGGGGSGSSGDELTVKSAKIKSTKDIKIEASTERVESMVATVIELLPTVLAQSSDHVSDCKDSIKLVNSVVEAAKKIVYGELKVKGESSGKGSDIRRSDKHGSRTNDHHGGSSSGGGGNKDSQHTKSSSTSSSRRSSSSSNRECSRCYKRSKIKRANAGVQCRRNDDLKALVQSNKPRLYNCSRATAASNCATDLKYERFYHVEVHSNGGASVVHLYQDELDQLTPTEMDELVDEFFSLVFREDDDGNAEFVMGIVHDAAKYLPDLLEHMADSYSTLTVKAGVMGRSSDIETSTLSQYNEQVCKA